MRDMYNLYAKRTVSELNQLRSKKYLKLLEVQRSNGFFAERDAADIQGCITAIDAELAKRKAQQPLF